MMDYELEQLAAVVVLNQTEAKHISENGHKRQVLLNYHQSSNSFCKLKQE